MSNNRRRIKTASRHRTGQPSRYPSPPNPVASLEAASRLAELDEVCRASRSPQRQQGSNCHPAPFPIEIARDHILSRSNECDLIFDPFGGSGTTAIAAENTNRKWVCCEISEEYTTKAVERIRNHQREDDGN